jgi:shikimate kinase
MAQRHIMIIGLPGAGKTTVGRLVATKLGAGYVDFDQVIVRKQGMPISQIFGLHGEQKFREMERQVAEEGGREATTGPGCQPPRGATSSLGALFIRVSLYFVCRLCFSVE